MSPKTIGMLGGMGPEATLNCFDKIIRNTPAEKDQEHLRIIIDSNPKVPDRTEAIIGDGESPVPMIVEGCRALERAGADFIIIPCVSAHFFLDAIRDQTELPILSIMDVMSETIAQDYPDINIVGLMATTGTIEGKTFQLRLAECGIRTIIPEDAVQTKIMEAIYDIKSARPGRSKSEITADLIAAAESLITRTPQGAQGIVAGCTEIPLALEQEHLSVPYFDALAILARAAIIRAGIKPLEPKSPRS